MRRKSLIAGMVLLGLPQFVFAQHPDPDCAVPQNGCQAPEGYYCPPQRYCGPGQCAPTRKNPETAPANPEGAFVAGPQRGEVAGESNSIGLRGGSLRIPSITIPLPTLQLPSFVRFRRDAELVTEPGTAPFVSGEVARFDVRPGGEPETTPVPETNDAPSNPQYYCPPPCTPGCAPGCVSSDTQRVEELALQIRQLNAAVAKLAELKAAEQQEVSSEPVDDLTGDVSYSPPRKTIRRPATRPAPKAPEVDYAALEAEAEAAERQVQFEERYAQKCAELEDTQARMEQIEIQHKQLLEANLQKISADREKRVRDRMGHTQSESKVVQSSYVDEEAPVVAPPKKLPTRPASLKKVPSTLTPVHSVDQVFGVQSNAPDWMRTGE